MVESSICVVPLGVELSYSGFRPTPAAAVRDSGRHACAEYSMCHAAAESDLSKSVTMACSTPNIYVQVGGTHAARRPDGG